MFFYSYTRKSCIILIYVNKHYSIIHETKYPRCKCYNLNDFVELVDFHKFYQQKLIQNNIMRKGTRRIRTEKSFMRLQDICFRIRGHSQDYRQQTEVY